MIRRIKDKTVEKSELRSANGNPNKIFKILYGSERRDLFKKYAQEQHRFPVEDDDLGVTDFNDINTWIKPIPGFGGNEYYNESVFDEIVKKLQEEDASRSESREVAKAQETEEEIKARAEAEKARNQAALEAQTEKTVKLKEGPGIEYLGIGGKYRIYAVTSIQGAQQFAVPTSSKAVGWCITGGRGSGWKYSSSYFPGQAERTVNKTFYVFEAANIEESWCVYALKEGQSSGAINPELPSIAFTDNKTDTNHYGIPKCDVPYEKVSILAEYAENTKFLNDKAVRANEETDGFYRFRGNTLLEIIDNTVTALNIPVAFVQIGNGAFSGLHDLETITFGSTLAHIGSQAFVGCSKLKEVTNYSNNYTLGSGVYTYCGELEEINLSGVHDLINDRCMAHCKNLKKVVLSTDLRSIGREAFLGCNQLTAIDIPASCTYIETNAFFGCKNLVIRTPLTEAPSGWYKNLADHIKAIEFAPKPEVKKEPVEEVKAEEVQEETTADSINDVSPKKGESKEDFISRFMSETANEYPDQKQRYAVALSYWEKKHVNDSETYSIWQMFNKDDCAGWIFKMSDKPELCVFCNSNNLGFLEEDEESMSDRLVVDEKIEIKPNLYIYVGFGEDKDVYESGPFERNGEALSTIDEAIADIKKSWHVEDSKKKLTNDSEMIFCNTKPKVKDDEITPKEQEVKEIVVNFSVQELVKEALDDLKASSDKDSTYEEWLKKSDEMLESNQITVNQQEEFEDELWKIYKEM